MKAPAAKRPCPAGLAAPEASRDAPQQQPVVPMDENVRALLEIISNQARRAMEPENQINIIPVAGFEAVRPSVTDCIRALTPFLHGLQYQKAVSIGRGAYSSVVRMEPAQGQAALTIKISKSAYPYHQVVSGHLGSDAAAYKFDDTRRVALRLNGGPGACPPALSIPFTVGVSEHSVGPSGLAYVRSREGGDDDPMYHAVLFMVGGLSTCEPVLNHLAEQFKAPCGRVEASAWPAVSSFFRCLLEPVASMHALGIAHRDIKGNNMVLVTAEPGQSCLQDTSGEARNIRLVDFGMAVYPGVKLLPRMSSGGASKGGQPTGLAVVTGGQHIATKRAHAIATAQSSVFTGPPPPVPLDATASYGAVPFAQLHAYFGCAPAEAGAYSMSPATVPPIGGARHFIPPENPATSTLSPTSSDFLKADMWAIGMMLLDILGGGLRREIKEKDEKLALARCTDLELWARYLGKKPTKRIPEPWIAVMSLLRGLLAEAPHLRLSAASALQHSFLA